MARRNQPRRYWRCPECHSPNPTAYSFCGNCGHDRRAGGRIILTRWTSDDADAFIERAKQVFPGSRET